MGWPGSVSLAATNEIYIIPIPTGTKMFQFPVLTVVQRLWCWDVAYVSSGQHKIVPSTPRHPPDAICPNNILVRGRMNPPTLGIHCSEVFRLQSCNNIWLSDGYWFRYCNNVGLSEVVVLISSRDRFVCCVSATGSPTATLLRLHLGHLPRCGQVLS